jgi:Flp pilus assembly protein TadB
MIAVVMLAGAGFAAGVCLLLSTVWHDQAASDAGPPPRARRLHVEVDARRVWLALGCGAAAGLVTRWPVVALGGAVLGWFLPLPGTRHAATAAEARTEALALWTEMLRDAAGTARGIEGMLTATASSAPAAIRPEVERMARRLEHLPLDTVLDGLATDLAHPLGDLVVTALRLASSTGSKRVRGVLDDLAAAAHQEASMRRRVDVARQRPRSTMRLVAIVVVVFIAGLLLFARTYLAPYGTALGQIVLALVAVYWGLGFWWMARMGRLPQVERFLAAQGDPS